MLEAGILTEKRKKVPTRPQRPLSLYEQRIYLGKGRAAAVAAVGMTINLRTRAESQLNQEADKYKMGRAAALQKSLETPHQFHAADIQFQLYQNMMAITDYSNNIQDFVKDWRSTLSKDKSTVEYYAKKNGDEKGTFSILNEEDFDGLPVSSQGAGTAIMRINGMDLELTNTGYTPAAACNLVSLGQLLHEGFNFEIIREKGLVKGFEVTDPYGNAFFAIILSA
ncbi:hypothetical protein AJ80_10056 [Polytolypa hystricis UAMH7299]|uniref:Uncharacterized protein n=1 Tax=Polytolypa hystricis (strain UAMH7299) TaxID=1447883 RepID=A0A2B7WEJ0_POLH7|nr:hypothetical protein AJ80_10056 [Polytolypa hystricis UAMH7299]